MNVLISADQCAIGAILSGCNCDDDCCDCSCDNDDGRLCTDGDDPACWDRE